MGMTNEQAISHLDTYSSTIGSGQTTQAQHEESKRVAIDTMRKYQKIEQIVEHWACCGNPSDSMIAISEVLEDGSENNHHASNS